MFKTYFIFCLLILGLMACQKPAGQANYSSRVTTTTTMTRQGVDMPGGDTTWEMRFAKGVPRYMTANGTGGWYFDFPFFSKTPATDCFTDPNCVYVSYVTQKVSDLDGNVLRLEGNIASSENASYTYALEPTNTPPNCNHPASFRFFLQREGDTYRPEQVYYRWWANPTHTKLGPGNFTMTVSLSAENWSSVNGKMGNHDQETQDGFDDAKDNVGNVGITFGGGCAFGHGVNVNRGNSRFSITKFLIE